MLNEVLSDIGMAKPYILRDSREKVNHGWEFPEDSNFAGTVIAKLKTGDYTIQGYEDILVVERKATITEWAANVFQDRFKNELERMRSFKFAYILFEFSLEHLLRFPYGTTIPKQQWPPYDGAVLLRKTLEFQIEYGVHMWMCDDADNASKLAHSLFKRIVNAKIK